MSTMGDNQYIQQLGAMITGKYFLLSSEQCASLAHKKGQGLAGRVVNPIEGSNDFWVEVLPLPPFASSGNILGYRAIGADILRNAMFFDDEWELDKSANH
jgi:hypothetical protein